MAKVLVIDDDPSLLRALRVGLRAGGHDVVAASTGEQGVAKVAVASPDVVVLDLGLPDIDGLTVCRRVREWSAVPIIVLSASDAEARKVSALDGGADDYVTKPFGMAELEARIRASLRHRQPVPGEDEAPELAAGDVSLDLVHREASRAGARLELTAKEFDLLAFLARHAGKVCTHQMILEAVWGRGYGTETGYLHAYVHRLRQKLDDPAGELLATAPGIGYRLSPPPRRPGQAASPPQPPPP